MRKTPAMAALAALAVAACTPVAEDSFTTPILNDVVEVGVTRGMGPPGADPEACYGREVRPGRVETVTEQIMVQPPQLDADGTQSAPAIFETETHQRIVEERRDLWFETPCQAETDPDFIASLQRALAARGLYDGPISGQMDVRTRRAVAAYQAPQGLDSGVLSMAAARQLGLSIWDPVLASGGTTGG